MPTVLSAELKEKIEGIKAKQTKIETRLIDSKKGVKLALVDGIMKAMTDEDFYKNSDYKKANADFRAMGATTDLGFRVWVGNLSQDEQINLLAEYTIDAEREKGHNDWEKPLNDAQKSKEVTKKAVAVQAKQVIESYKKLMVEHEKLITELKQKVEKKKTEIDKIDDKIDKKNNQIIANNETLKAAKNAVPTQDQIDAVKSSNERLKGEIDELKAEREQLVEDFKKLEESLTEMEEQKDVYQSAIDDAISELEESLKKDGIYVGSYEGLGGSSEQEAQNGGNEQVSQNGVAGSVDERKPKDIAKAMMTDFRNLAPEEIMEMIEHTGYGDLLNMSRELGPFNRKNFEKVMENRLQDLEEGLEATIKDSNGNDKVIKLTLQDLEDLSDLNDSKFNKVQKIMKYYTDNYHKMAVHERQEAERVMNYLKIANLLTESQRGKISRFVGRFTQKGTRINEIGNSLRRFATERGKRESKKWERNQDIRTRLGVKTPIPSTTRKKHINRTGDNPIKQIEIDD